MFEIVQAASKTKTISHLPLRLTLNPVTLTWSCPEETTLSTAVPTCFPGIRRPHKEPFVIRNSMFDIRFILT